jgi:hypothetical protein
MANLNKIPVVWSGGPGMPGVSIFYSDSVSGPPLGALGAFFTAIKASFPTGLSWTIPGSGDVLDSSTGVLNGSWSAAGGSTVAASGAATSYAGAAGAFVRWQTSGIVNGRRVKGRTFLVPLISSVYASGVIQTGTVSAFQSAANTFVASAGADMRIWHRPTAGAGGIAYPITAAVVPNLATVLRSRRD